ncbi:MAG: formate--tetrahydrofolate ligase [Bacilli bacterium]|nr:formate--tetrahydrofolate ligase [Bacilli bacterium]
MKTDLEIAQAAKMLPIEKIAEKIGLDKSDIETYGPYKAKISLNAVLDKSRYNKDGRVILVSAINPTPAGEGKSTTTIGLGDALNKLGYKAMVALREPSLGPVMGVKGGAAGGGYSQVVPMEDINLHFTGDIHAVTSANNLISAVIDNHLYQGNSLKIDPNKVIWKRAMDMNDRALRSITVGLSSRKETPRPDGFDISVASEVMAVLCLSKNLEDLRRRLEKMVVAYDVEERPVTVADLKVAGAVTMLLKDAIKPNLVQSLENTPVLIHGGPFANIAHGCNSVIATEFASRASEFIVTEAGFGADLGMEKFMDIKSRVLGKKPSAVVIVASIRAMKLHGGMDKKTLGEENLEALEKGLENLDKHVENVKFFNVPSVVALNRFASDTEAEIDLVRRWSERNNQALALSEVFTKGSTGGIELAKKVLDLINENKDNEDASLLYNLDESIEAKITTIARKIYGAAKVEFSDRAKMQLNTFAQLGWDKLPICMAKTPLSLTDDAKILGRPRNFTITIRELKPSLGAGFIVALTGEVMTMPGLPKQGAYENMDVIDNKIVGLF